MPSGYIPGRTDLGLTVQDIRRPVRGEPVTTRAPDTASPRPVGADIVKDFERWCRAKLAQWALEDEANWALATRSFAARVAAR